MEDGRLLFAYGELTDGCYFGEPSCTKIPQELKRLASVAQGQDGTSAHLTSLGSWFAKHFGMLER